MTTSTVTRGVGQPLRWLGGPVDVRVEVDSPLDAATFGIWDVSEWDAATWGTADPEWADVSPFVESVTINRGRDRWQDRHSAGAASIVLDNTTGIFSPITADSGAWGRWEVAEWDDGLWGDLIGEESPFYLPWRPGRKIRVVAVPDPFADPDDPDAKIPLFTGTIDAISDQFGDGGFWIRSVVTALDPLADLAQNDPPMLETPTGVESTDDRIRSALARFGDDGWPLEDVEIDEGFHTMQSSHLAQSTLEECQRAAEAEGGAFYARADGSLVFRNRDWLSEAPRSVAVQAWLGYAPGQIPDGAVTGHVVDVSTSWELARIRNHVALARVGGTVVDLEDVDSITRYGRRTHRRLDYQNATQAQIVALATRMLAALSENRLRVDAVSVVAPDDDYRILHETRIGDLVAVRVQTGQGWGYSRPSHVMGISHHITAEDWTVTLMLDDATFHLTT